MPYLQIVIPNLLLCILGIGQVTFAGTTNLPRAAPNHYPAPGYSGPPSPILPNSNFSPSILAYTIPPQIEPSTNHHPEDHEQHNRPIHHNPTSTTVTTPAPTTTTTPSPSTQTFAPVTLTTTTMAPPTPSSISTMIVSRPSTTTTVVPKLVEDRQVIPEMTTTGPVPEDYMLYGTTAPDSNTPREPNRSYDDLTFAGSSNTEAIQQPSQDHSPQDNSAQSRPAFSDQTLSGTPAPKLEQPSNVSLTNPPNDLTPIPPLTPEVPVTQTLPILNANISEAMRETNKQLNVSKILPEGRSDDRPQPMQTITSQISPSVAMTNLTITNPSDRRHQLLKPKSKFKCSGESDCNNGTCVNGKCYCEPGFTGESCSINIDECLQFGSEPCLNNGTCVDDIGTFKCNCLPGFSGDRCQDLADMCKDSPCLNGATCSNHRTDYTCTCQPGWEGKHCENNIDDCLKSPCENGAVCHDLVNGYKCECQQGFTGPNCEVNVDDCARNMCQNNSTCRDQANDYECVCEPGWRGKNCEENIDECQSNPCRHGICTDLTDEYSCKCDDGYTGRNCDLDINECMSHPPVCQNGATCLNNEGSYKCSCKDGFTGDKCSSISDICKARQPCKNGGICKTLSSQKYRCECHSGYLGSNCERKRACDPHDCNFDHAHCVSNVTCACLPGRREERTMCEYVTSCEQVEGDLCLHGGKCKNLEQGGYHCTCEDPWYGPVCQFQAEPQFDAILLVVITCVGFLLAACAVVSLVIFRSVRKARATRGTYSPSTQEKFGNSASDLLKLPNPERLI